MGAPAGRAAFAEEKKFLGFHKLLYTDSYRMKDGKEIFHGDRVETRANTSWIIYTPTGHMMVHLMDNKGRTDTPARSRRRPRRLPRIAATAGTSDGSPPTKTTTRPFVLHNQQGTLRPGGENDATKRFYQFNGNVLRSEAAERERGGRNHGRPPVLGKVPPPRTEEYRNSGTTGSE